MLPKLLAELVVLRCVLTAAVLAAAGAVSVAAGVRGQVLLATGCVVLACLAETVADAFRAVAVACEAPNVVATAQLIQRGTTAVLVLAALLVAPSLIAVSLAYLAGTAIGVLATALGAARLGIRPQWSHLRWTGIAQFSRASHSGGLHVVASMALFRIDTVLLAALAGAAAAGRYAAAYRLLETVIFVAWTVARSVFPIMASSPQTWRVRRGAERGLVVLASVFLPYMALLWCRGADVMRVLYGDSLPIGDVVVLAWLAPAPLLFGAGYLAAYVLMADGPNARVLLGSVGALIINVDAEPGADPALRPGRRGRRDQCVVRGAGGAPLPGRGPAGGPAGATATVAAGRGRLGGGRRGTASGGAVLAGAAAGRGGLSGGLAVARRAVGPGAGGRDPWAVGTTAVTAVAGRAVAGRAVVRPAGRGTAGGETRVTGPLRVTVVSGAGVLGGAELWLLAILRGTDRLAVNAIVLGAGPLVEELTALGVPATVLATGRSPASLAHTVFRLCRRLSASQPDIVLANGVKAAAAAAPAAMVAGVRCVWVKHDHSFDGRPTAALVARLVDGAVVASPTLAAPSGRPDAVVVPPPRAVLSPLPREAARAVLAQSGVDADDPRPVLAVVGRLVRYKGVEDAVRALACPGGDGWRLAIIGDADPAESGERERLRQLAAAAGVADRVVFTGALRDAASLLSGVDAVGVLTKPTGSGPDREGFGSVATEAMLAGVPVVATWGGPIVDRLAGRAGLGVPPGDPAAVAAALGQLADPDQRRAMGTAGVELSASHPDAATCAEALVAELARVACRPGAGRHDGPPITVITTVLDEAVAVDRLLHRVVGQFSEPGDEIVVVDGGSRDATVARVRAWADRDPRVRLISLPGAGISAGRNAAVRAARNTLIACTDAGCDPVPGWLAAFRQAAADSDPAIAGQGTVNAARRGPGRLFTGVYRATADGPLQTASAAVGYPDPDELRHPVAAAPGVRSAARSLVRPIPAHRPLDGV